MRRASITPVQLKSPTLIRAEEVQSNLGGDLPCFLKPLVRSHVGSCFWMVLIFAVFRCNVFCVLIHFHVKRFVPFCLLGASCDVL